MTARTTTSQTGYCVSCRWWRQEWSEYWGSCRLQDRFPRKSIPASEMPALLFRATAANETTSSYLMTRIDFGCVQWAARNEEADALKDQGGSA